MLASRKRPAGDRLQMLPRLGHAHEQVPPIVDQRHVSCGQLAACQILRREPAPPPLVLQFVECILAICAIAIERALRHYLVIERGDQRGIFPFLLSAFEPGK